MSNDTDGVLHVFSLFTEAGRWKHSSCLLWHISPKYSLTDLDSLETLDSPLEFKTHFCECEQSVDKQNESVRMETWGVFGVKCGSV